MACEADARNVWKWAYWPKANSRLPRDKKRVERVFESLQKPLETRRKATMPIYPKADTLLTLTRVSVCCGFLRARTSVAEWST
jgi:hypothetical protein